MLWGNWDLRQPLVCGFASQGVMCGDRQLESHLLPARNHGCEQVVQARPSSEWDGELSVATPMKRPVLRSHAS